MLENIVRSQKITRVPKAQPYFRGVINLRGEICPIMSMRIKLALEPDVITDKTRFIIVKLEKYGKIGLIVDAVKEVVTLTPEQIEKMKYDANDDVPHFVAGVGKTDNGLVSLLDIDVVTYDKSMKED